MEHDKAINLVDDIEALIHRVRSNGDLGLAPTILIAFQDILSALRSCDDDGKNVAESMLLKSYTTGRLRAIVTPHFVGGIRLTPLSNEEMAKRDAFLAKAPKHFRAHWEVAVIGVKLLYNYDLTEERVVTKGE